MSHPLVTVLICNYNYQQWILKAIDSVVQSNYPKDKINLCIVDDCSTDNSVEEVHSVFTEDEVYEYGPSEVSIGYVEDIKTYLVALKENVGPSEARNIGIDRTLHCSEYYLILDADDQIKPNKIAYMVNEAQRMPNLIGAVYADYEVYDYENDLHFVEYKESFSYPRLLEECIVHSGSLINKNALLAVKDQFGYYDREMRTCEDYDLWIRISNLYGIVHIPEVLSCVTVHDRNSTNTVDTEIWQKNWNRITEKIRGIHSSN